jgi:carbon-monoxide dehydrogenase medium subunit/putative selenate reductase FAD-binding subunit
VATADSSSEFLASLLVHGAEVRLAGRDGLHSLGLATLLANRAPLAGRIIAAVAVETGGVTSAARTARTRADRAIVAAVARRTTDGERRLALTGVAATPVLVAAEDAANGLHPPGDFRGSSEYRHALAAVLAKRALRRAAARREARAGAAGDRRAPGWPEPRGGRLARRCEL